jgi:hypothetical protein
MPHKPYWWREGQRILKLLAGLADPLLGRQEVQTVFRVSPTEAHRIMHKARAWRVGGALVVPVWQLKDWTRAVINGKDAVWEGDRVGRLEGILAEERKRIPGRKVRIPVAPDGITSGEVPSGVTLEDGKMTVEFFGTEDLLAKLMELAMFAQRDYQGFTGLVEGIPPVLPSGDKCL